MCESEAIRDSRAWRERALEAEESEQRARKDCLLALKENEYLRSLQRQLELSQATLLETQSQLGHALAHENEYKAKHLHLAGDLRELCHEVRLIASDVISASSLTSMLPQDFDPDSLQPYHAKAMVHMLRDAYLKAELRVRNRETELLERSDRANQVEELLGSWCLLFSRVSDPPQEEELQQLSEELKRQDKSLHCPLREVQESLSSFSSAAEHGYRALSSELSMLHERVCSCLGEGAPLDSAQLGLSLKDQWIERERILREMEMSIKEREKSHLSEMTGAISALKLEMAEQRTEKDLQKEREMERELAQKLAEIRSESASGERKERLRHRREVEKLSSLLSTAERERESMRQNLESESGRARACEAERNKLSEEAEQLRGRMGQREREGKEGLLQVETRSQEEVGVYREQMRQHAFTIVSLEDKLVRSVQEREGLRDSLRESTATANREREETHRKDIETIRRERNAFEGESFKLKSELQHEKSTGDQLCAEIANLKANVTQLKRRLLIQVEQLHFSEKKLEKTRVLVAKLERSLEERITRGVIQREELTGLRENMPHVRETVDDIHQNLTLLSHDFSDYRSLQDLGSPLVTAGSKCTEEQHTAIISRQAQAISELRASVEQLKEANLLIPTHQQALRELTSLRKELRDAKAALSGSDLVYALRNGDIVEDELQKQLRTRDAAHLQEKLQHEQTSKSLEISEVSFKHLVDALLTSMRLQIPLENSPLLKMSEAELELEQLKRTKQIEMARVQLKVMYDNMKQSQVLVTEYQKDQIEELRVSLEGVQGELSSQRELSISLQAQRDYLKTEKLVAKRHTMHNCTYTKECMQEKLVEERRKHKEKMKQKEQEIVALRATLVRLNET